ncbi:MAG: hypothetical protein PHG85_00145 [Candidatus Altiarchaeota archaeon]|nr:hypothetical protein [Candidatus Altiarchaeota archaeon]
MTRKLCRLPLLFVYVICLSGCLCSEIMPKHYARPSVDCLNAENIDECKGITTYYGFGIGHPAMRHPQEYLDVLEKEDPFFCQIFSEYLERECLKAMQPKGGTLQVKCDRIKDISHKCMCYNYMNATDSLKLCHTTFNSSIICQRSTPDDGRYVYDGHTYGSQEECFRENGKTRKDLNLCEIVTEGEPGYEWTERRCYKAIALKTMNITICKSLYYEDDQNLCIMSAARTKKDIQLCDLISENVTERGQRIQPYTAICLAAVTADEKYCSNISKDYKELCSREVGISKNDPTTCDALKDIFDRDRCYKTFALALHKPGICDMINKVQSGQMMVDACIESAKSDTHYLEVN